MILANDSIDEVFGSVSLPLTINQVTKQCEDLNVQGSFDMLFSSRSRQVFIPDGSGEQHPLNVFLIEKEGCSGVVSLTRSEKNKLDEFLKRKVRPRVAGQLGATHMTQHSIKLTDPTPIKELYRIVSSKIQEAMHAEVNRMLAEGIIEP